MTGPTRSTIATLFGSAILLLGLSACEKSPTPLEPERTGADQEIVRLSAPVLWATRPDRDVAALRRSTARFHRVENAREAGHTALVRHPDSGAACLAHPTDGGMGRHYLDPSLVDDAVSVTEPEVVIYEPMDNGRLRLVAVEYIIPYSIRGPEETPPTLFGRDFLHNPTFQLWMLHVYAWKENPNGMFATWNPRITCEHDDDVG